MIFPLRSERGFGRKFFPWEQEFFSHFCKKHLVFWKNILKKYKEERQSSQIQCETSSSPKRLERPKFGQKRVGVCRETCSWKQLLLPKMGSVFLKNTFFVVFTRPLAVWGCAPPQWLLGKYSGGVGAPKTRFNLEKKMNYRWIFFSECHVSAISSPYNRAIYRMDALSTRKKSVFSALFAQYWCRRKKFSSKILPSNWFTRVFNSYLAHFEHYRANHPEGSCRRKCEMNFCFFKWKNVKWIFFSTDHISLL